MQRDIAAHLVAIRNAGWFVRHYGLQRTAAMRAQRAAAIAELGDTCQRAFNATARHEREPILLAIVEGLVPRDEPRF